MSKSKRAPGVRRAEIRRILRSQQSATVEELCALLQASPATIRRDLAALADNDELERSHGGAVVPLLREAEQNFAQRESIDAEEKQAIAEAVLPLIAPASTLFMNDGTTVMAIAKVLVESGIELFVATPAVNVAAKLSESRAITACLLGGFVRQTSLATTGPFAEAMAAQINADLAIISPDGLHAEHGLTFMNADDASLARRMVAQSRSIVAVATRPKLMSVKRVAGVALSSVDHLVCGCSRAEIPAPLTDSGVNIISRPKERK
ncbi:DeoR/GlpR family DNA-binding transcription regulator [Hyphomicrobium sp.]|uniref:DeoR/GlpR family DNA-binding transcription regulator n=1 Tax=Hyphomicrobium sp. TaxID=82 RepID=UPI002D78A9C1|nr:DeoR/GlpR family DNA-binding transcription regulator [Hyphomicrobium sp.]HET6388098.1 DeoR/GlpR family DNA-binding transcription regulator [Hyphomicrobium sp.]